MRCNFMSTGGSCRATRSRMRRWRSISSNAKKFPDYWTTHLGLARVYSAKGDFDKAVKEMKLSLSGSAGCEQECFGDLCEAVGG